ncbi:hypothetical protein N9Y42_03040 [Mariniblastus sp.]|nr:hypothetical protein [Mariniblastus sp.]
MNRSKIDELAIFTAGLGGIIAAVLIWLTIATPTNAGRSISAFITPPLVAACLLMLLGLVIKLTRNKAVIYFTLALVVLLFLVDLLLGFNPIKALISGTILYLIIKNGREAIREADGY